MWFNFHLSLLLLMALTGMVQGQSSRLCTTADGKAGQCRPLVKCVRFFHEIEALNRRPCPLSTGQKGVCCPHIVVATATLRKTYRKPVKQSFTPNNNFRFRFHRRPHFYHKYIYYYTYTKPSSSVGPSRGRGSGRVLRRPPPPPVPIPNISRSDINSARQRARQRQQRRREIEQRLLASGLVVGGGRSGGQGRGRSQSPTAKHRRLQRTTARARQLGERAMEAEDTAEELMQSFQLSALQGTHALPVFSLVGTSLEINPNNIDDDICEIEQSDSRKCRTAELRFRTIDGSCNNERHVHWGQANIALQRLLDPKYEDGISLPRGQNSPSSQVSRLPSPRTVSEALIADINRPNSEFTLMLMQWGQFLDHDLTHTPMVRGDDDTDVLCCSNNRALEGDLKHPECLPIPISASDSFYSRFGQQCMEFVRSMPARNKKCNLGPREQVNQITGFMDASNVYGSEVAEARSLRLGRNGRLRVTKFNNEELLPLNPDECADHGRRQYCFTAGDIRCNEQPQLTVMHTLWLREHNRVASQLALLNPHWDDERVYQEARKVVGAEIQHITFNEWLPIILGMNYMDENRLSPLKSGMSNDYDPDVEPSITNAFATAAFRFGHSLVQGNMEAVDVFGNIAKSLQLHQHQQEPFEIYEANTIDGLIRGLTTQPAQELDSSFSKELTERLFEEPNSGHGLDLVALNIQRGRDHGLPPYVEYRRLCKLPDIRDWRELTRVVEKPELVPRLQRLYSSVDEIDLFLGGILETPERGALLGPTFRCLVGDQFKRLKWGDRFWFEEAGQVNSFSQAQVDAIRQSSLARVLCDNGEGIDQVQPLAFKSAKGMNSLTLCSGDEAIPRVNLESWRE